MNVHTVATEITIFDSLSDVRYYLTNNPTQNTDISNHNVKMPMRKEPCPDRRTAFISGSQTGLLCACEKGETDVHSNGGSRSCEGGGGGGQLKEGGSGSPVLEIV